jgi:hypothetical protein
MLLSLKMPAAKARPRSKERKNPQEREGAGKPGVPPESLPVKFGCNYGDAYIWANQKNVHRFHNTWPAPKTCGRWNLQADFR